MKSSIIICLILSLVSCTSHKKHWSYSGDTGPENWGKLAGCELCSSGKNQSPINIQDTVKAELKAISFNYNTNPVKILNNGHTVQVNIAPGSTIEVENTTFELKQFHFHTPSENTIKGKSFPLEAHFVHADAKVNLAVLAVMFDNGSTNPALEKFWNHMPMKKDDNSDLTKEQFMLMDLMPKDKSYYRFNGSLTTPPCTEGVRWFVFKSSITASQAQVKKFLDVLGHPNNRPIQPVNARIILE
jgi:carbonic anhydrase